MTTRTVAVPGGTVEVDDDWTTAAIATDGWERALHGIWADAIRPGHTVLDVGAHVGLHTVGFAERVGAGGRVHAFEPMPDNAARLRRNILTNGYGPRVAVVEAAVADAPAQRPLWRYAGDRYPGASSMLYSLVGGPGYEPAPAVDVTTLDAHADAHGVLQVDFVKIDVEGAELRVLRGARQLLARSPRATLLIELHPHELATDGSSVADVVAYLEAMRRTVFHLIADGDGARAIPRRPGEAIIGQVLLAR